MELLSPFERIKYNKSPLKNVVCQLRFPPILVIDSNEPSEFQDLLRKNGFPIYEKTIEYQHDFSIVANNPSSNQIKMESNSNHEFYSLDKSLKVNLTKNFISLSTENYSTWDDFKSKLILILEKFNNTYSPALYTRVGLRYIDIFERSVMGFDPEEKNWSDLISPEFLGYYLNKESKGRVKSFNLVNELTCDDGVSRMRVNSGTVINNISREECIQLDNDCYNEENTNVENVTELLDILHRNSRLLLNEAITEELHLNMDPVNLDEQK